MDDPGGPIRVLAVTTASGFAEWAGTTDGVGQPLRVTTAGSVAAGTDLLAAERFDCVVADYELPDGDGISLLERVRAESPALPVVLFPAAGSEAVASEAITAGVTDYVRDTGEADQYRRLAERIADLAGRERRDRSNHPEVLARAMDEAPIGAVITDPSQADNPIVYANEAFEELSGYAAEAVLGRNCRFMQTEATDDEPVARMREAIDAAEPVTVTLRNERADGTEFWNRVTIAPLRAGNGEVTHYVGFQREVTEQVERERELEVTQQRFQALTENTTFAVLTIDADSVVQYANDGLADVLGYAPEDLIGESLLSIMPERFHDEHLAAIERYLETGTPTRDWEWIELTGRHRDGHEVPLGVSFGETEIEGDRRFTAILRDITERTERERERAATVEFLRALYDVTTDADAEFETKIARLLDLGCDRLGLPYGFLSRIEPPEGDGRGVQKIVHATGDHELLQPGESCPLAEAYCRKTIQTDGILAVEDAVDEGWTDDPAYETFELGCYIGGKLTTDGDLYGTLCFAATEACPDPLTEADRTLVRLMSRWVSYELEREQTRRELRHQNDRLDQFASVVSHDLRNPLNVANLNLEIAATETDSERIEEARDALGRMDDIIDDALMFAREGQAVEETEPVSLAALAERCWDNCLTEAGELVVAGDLAFVADPERAGRLLENLFRNAFEHNPEGVTVTVGPIEEDGFYVADDGTGIPAADVEEVFTSGYSSSDGGTGLGLAIVRETAQAHGWTIDVAASESGGARFEFTDLTVRERD